MKKKSFVLARVEAARLFRLFSFSCKRCGGLNRVDNENKTNELGIYLTS